MHFILVAFNALRGSIYWKFVSILTSPAGWLLQLILPGQFSFAGKALHFITLPFAHKRANFCVAPKRSHSLHFVDCNYVAASAAAAARPSVRPSKLQCCNNGGGSFAGGRLCVFLWSLPFSAVLGVYGIHCISLATHNLCILCPRTLLPRCFLFNVRFAPFLLCIVFVAYIMAHFIKICCHCFRLSLFYIFCCFPLYCYCCCFNFVAGSLLPPLCQLLPP